MIARFGFTPAGPSATTDATAAEAMAWIAAHCRKVAEAHTALAERAEGLMDRFLDNRRFRTGLRTFARHHRRAAWQHLEAARRIGRDDFDMADVASA